MVTSETIHDWFYQGKYQDVVSEILDQAKTPLRAEIAPPLIASLTFLGRIDEAELIYSRFLSSMNLSERVMARFFLGVVRCRHFDFANARRYFGENAGDLKNGTAGDFRSRFFVYQGFGFYRYTYGHLRAASKWAKRAYEAAFQADYLFGRLFSQDLLAHCEINLGKTHAGMKLFEQNMSLAASMKRDGTLQMSRVTRAIYRARFGISLSEATEELLATMAQTTFEDGYSRACLLAELSHQYLLRGNALKAKETLGTACEYVYRMDNPRLEILLNFRIAVMLTQKGDFAEALHLVSSSLKRLESKADKYLELKLRGLEHKLLLRLHRMENLSKLETNLEALTKRTGDFVANRMLDRRRGIFLSSQTRLQDPLGDLLDDIERNPHEAVWEILEKGWWGLLYRACAIDPASKTLLLGMNGKSLTLFDQGNVRHLSRGASNQVAKFLAFLSDSPRSKEQIVNEVWAESYHPLRHDPLLYTLVSKLRKELGPHSPWVEASDHGYQLQQGIAVKQFETTNPESAEPELDVSETEWKELSFRQRKILGLARKSSYVDVGILGEAFKISSATANRDLSQLEREGWLARSGKGRATRYHFQEGKP